MKANELRIGNFIFYANGDICKVSYHQIRYLIITTEKVNYNPIPLTEEWLLKFGFENKNKKKNWIYSAYGLKINNGKIISGLGGKMVCVEYVHQLQNLYFALTNEELIIKQA